MSLSFLLHILFTPCGGFLYCIRMREGGQKINVVLTCPLQILPISCGRFLEIQSRRRLPRHVLICSTPHLVTACGGFVYCSRMREGGQKMNVVLTCPLHISPSPCGRFLEIQRRRRLPRHVLICSSLHLGRSFVKGFYTVK
jgi:hypothetical protein